MGKDYSQIENVLSKRYRGLLSAAASPDLVRRAEATDYNKEEKKGSGFFEFFTRPALQYAGAILLAVVVCGGTFFGILKLSSMGSVEPPSTSAVTDAPVTEKIIIKSDVTVNGEKTKIMDLDRAGRDIEVKIYFENVTDLISAALKISWGSDAPENKVTLINAEYFVRGLVNTPETGWDQVQSTFNFNWVALQSEDALKSDSDFVKLTFRVSDDARTGRAKITIEPDQSNIFDSNSKDVPFELERDTIEIWFENQSGTEILLPDTTITPTDTETVPPDTDTTAPETTDTVTTVPDEQTAHETTDEITTPPGPLPMVYPAYLIVSDDNEEIYPAAYEGSADVVKDVPVLQYDGSKIKLTYLDMTAVKGVTDVNIGIKVDGVPRDYYESYINDYLKNQISGTYRFVMSFEITKNGNFERWEYPFDVEVWIKEEITTTPEETTGPDETTTPETTAPNTTVPETEAETISFVTEPDNHREKESKQTVHFTDESVEVPSDMSGHKSGIHCGETSNVAFRVLDCGYEQYEKLMEISGQALPDATADMLEKISAGELKIWLCDLDGNKIDYVYANKNGIVAFDLYPGEYKLTYEDDGTYKTAYSNIVKVYDESTEKENKTYYRVFNDYETVGSQAYICIYNYQRYRPVTVTVTDDKTGAPVADTAVVYFADYIYSDAEYLRTDENGVLTLNSIFDFMLYKKPGNITSWHREISLYFKNEEYDRIKIKEENILQNTFDIKLHKTEYTEYTVKVINKQTGEPMKNVCLEGNSTLHGDFIIRESGEDGIMKGYLPSEDLTNLYGGKAFPEVHVKYGAVNPAALYLPLYNGVYDFTLYYIETNGVGRFEIAE